MSLIFLNPLSEVTSGSCKNMEVAAIIASGVFTARCWRIFIAIFFISGAISIMMQSFSRYLSFLLSEAVSLCQPNSSISEITETTAVPSKNGFVSGNPSCTLIRKLVSATKLIPFIPHFFLVGCSVQSPLKFTKMLPQRFCLLFLGNTGKSFPDLFFSYGFSNLYNHNKTFIRLRYNR